MAALLTVSANGAYALDDTPQPEQQTSETAQQGAAEGGTSDNAVEGNSGDGAAVTENGGTQSSDTSDDSGQTAGETDSADGNATAGDADTGDATDADTQDSGNAGSASDTAESAKPAAQADAAGESSTQADESDYDAHTVTTVDPEGTSINLFDYWLTEQNAADRPNPNDYLKKGINADHSLKFGDGMSDPPDYNIWTGSGKVRSGMVDSTLGENGYPTLKDVTQDNNTYPGESLSYLFNSSSSGDKAVYSNAKGLLQVDDQGYYSYDSHSNFASFDTSANRFKVYDTWGVKKGGTSPDGQFFPFNTASQVFDIADNGSLTQKDGVCSKYSTKQSDCTSASTGTFDINHYFGLTMTTRFKQTVGGMSPTQPDTPVTYEFSGDDDVWVFIDDVLVGDLGGIHNAASLSINFSTGVVKINNGDTATGSSTTLKQLYEDAEKADVTKWRDGGDTFADNTYHTLKFFYLERGNVDSNMSLKFNLVTTPESDVLKVDQVGNPVAGAEFALIPTDEDYSSDGTTLYTGTTESNGELVFKHDDGSPWTLQELKQRSAHYILRETTVPPGYRKTGDMHLELREENGKVYIVSTNHFDTGAYAAPKALVTATSELYGEKNGEAVKIVTDSNGNVSGTLFAVVLQYNSKLTGCPSDSVSASSSCWQALSGTNADGWTAAEDENGKPLTGFNAVIKAAQQDSVDGRANVLRRNTNALYEVSLNNLPGSVADYSYMNGENPKFTVAYYYTTGTIAKATRDNTMRLISEGSSSFTGSGLTGIALNPFEREFSTRLEVPNIKNILVVQKLDEQGNAINASTPATFTLYKDNNGSLGDVYQTVTTEDLTADDNSRLALQSAQSFPSVGSNGILENGTYWLKETAAPYGYTLNDHYVKVVVDNTGVHADATAYTEASGQMEQVSSGTQDRISVAVGVGTLVRTMAQFATQDVVDQTLTNITGTLQTSADNTNYTDAAPAQSKRYVYSGADGGGLLQYGYKPANLGTGETATLANSTFEVDDGYAQVKNTVNGGDLNGHDISALTTGSTIVRVGDELQYPTAQVQVRKQVTGADWTAPDGRNFTFELTYAGYTKPAGSDETTAGKVTYLSTSTDGKVQETELKANGKLSVATDGEIKQGAITDPLKFTELFFSNEGTYTFTLKEVKPDSTGGWSYDTTGLNGTTVTITVTADLRTGVLSASVPRYTKPGAQSGTTEIPIFVNAYVAVSSLPLTGGRSARDWLIYGGALGVLALLACASYTVWRKCRLV